VIYIEKRKGIHINDKNTVNENNIFDILVLQQDAVEMKLLYTPHTSTLFTFDASLCDRDRANINHFLPLGATAQHGPGWPHH
jgi:hypothetical protein